MGIFLSKKERAAKKGYRNLVKQKTTLAARQAYANEAVKVAVERAKAKARQPTLGQKLGSYAKKKLANQPRRTARKVVTKTKLPKAPMNLNQALYGGY